MSDCECEGPDACYSADPDPQDAYCPDLDPTCTDDQLGLGGPAYTIYPADLDPQQPASVQYYVQATRSTFKGPPPSYSPGQLQRQPYPPQALYGPQRTANNVIVIQQQPQPVVVQPNRRYTEAGNGAMVFAVGMTVFALVSGCLWALICSVPAILLAFWANSAGHRGDNSLAETVSKISIFCSIFALFVGVGGLVALIGLLAWYYLV